MEDQILKGTSGKHLNEREGCDAWRIETLRDAIPIIPLVDLI